jgi:hypothetical protein
VDKRLWFLNLIITALIDTFLIVYIIPYAPEMGSWLVLLILVATSLTALMISKIILTPVNFGRGKKYLFTVLLAVFMCILGVVTNMFIFSLVGFAVITILILIQLKKRW